MANAHSLIILSLVCLITIVQPVPLSSSLQEEGEEEAFKLWQTFCSGDSDKNNRNGGLFVFCSPTPLNEEIPEVNLRLNHDIKVSPEEKYVKTEEKHIKTDERPSNTERQRINAVETYTKTEQETPKPDILAEIPRGRSTSQNRTRTRVGRRRFNYARKNTIELQSKGEQSTRSISSTSEKPNESVTEISISSSQNEAKTVSEVIQQNATVPVVQAAKKKDGTGSSRPLGRRRLGGRRVAVLDAKPITLFVSPNNTTSESTSGV